MPEAENPIEIVLNSYSSERDVVCSKCSHEAIYDLPNDIFIKSTHTGGKQIQNDYNDFAFKLQNICKFNFEARLLSIYQNPNIF